LFDNAEILTQAVKIHLHISWADDSFFADG
jgi:hypothetical protein